MKQFEFATLQYTKSISVRKVYEFTNHTAGATVTIEETDWRKVVSLLSTEGWEIKHVEEGDNVWFQREKTSVSIEIDSNFQSIAPYTEMLWEKAKLPPDVYAIAPDDTDKDD